MSSMTLGRVPRIPESAPFTPEQREWLNGFLAGMLGQSGSATPPPPPALRQEEEFPWHDPALPLPERLELAKGKPLARRLMAAMAQLDCGSCGHNCKEYAERIASGDEADLTKCSPGGRETSRKLKELASAELVVSARPAAPPAADPKRPATGRFVEARKLTGDASAKDVRHVVIDLDGSCLTYEAGDSLGVHPYNCRDLVAHLLDLLGALGNEPVPTPRDGYLPLAEALRTAYAITTPADPLVELLAGIATAPGEAGQFRRFLEADGVPDGIQIADLLEMFPSARPSVEAFVAALVPLQPRLYSISSSPRAHPREVHLTVGVVRYTNPRNRPRKGVASTFLGERVGAGDELKLHVHPANAFRPPSGPDVPVIMVGPGTGIAPFRAFLHDRMASGSRGRNWLFFGDQKRDSDFLYRDELESFVASGHLSRLDLAFSRDSARKVYVQHRMKENATELYRWLEDGAHFYVCGDAKRMARDVDDALRDIVREQGNLTGEQASDYVAQLKAQNRYARDVY